MFLNMMNSSGHSLSPPGLSPPGLSPPGLSPPGPSPPGLSPPGPSPPALSPPGLSPPARDTVRRSTRLSRPPPGPGTPDTSHTLTPHTLTPKKPRAASKAASPSEGSPTNGTLPAQSARGARQSPKLPAGRRLSSSLKKELFKRSDTPAVPGDTALSPQDSSSAQRSSEVLKRPGRRGAKKEASSLSGLSESPAVLTGAVRRSLGREPGGGEEEVQKMEAVVEAEQESVGPARKRRSADRSSGAVRKRLKTAKQNPDGPETATPPAPPQTGSPPRDPEQSGGSDWASSTPPPRTDRRRTRQPPLKPRLLSSTPDPGLSSTPDPGLASADRRFCPSPSPLGARRGAGPDDATPSRGRSLCDPAPGEKSAALEKEVLLEEQVLEEEHVLLARPRGRGRPRKNQGASTPTEARGGGGKKRKKDQSQSSGAEERRPASRRCRKRLEPGGGAQGGGAQGGGAQGGGAQGGGAQENAGAASSAAQTRQTCRPRFQPPSESESPDQLSGRLDPDESALSSDLSIELSLQEDHLISLPPTEEEEEEEEEEDEEELPSFLMDRKPLSITDGMCVWCKFRNYPFWPAMVKSVNRRLKKASIVFIDDLLFDKKRIRKGFTVALKTLKPFYCEEADQLVCKAREKYDAAITWCLELIADYRIRIGCGSFTGSFVEYFSDDISCPVRRKAPQGAAALSFPSPQLLEEEESEEKKEVREHSAKKLLPDRSKAARNRANEKLVHFIVKQRKAEGRLLAVISGQQPSRWLRAFLRASRGVVDPYLEDEGQVDQVYLYLRGVFSRAPSPAPGLAHLDVIRFVLDVLLPEAIIHAIAGVDMVSLATAEDKYLRGPCLGKREREEFDQMIERQIKAQRHAH